MKAIVINRRKFMLSLWVGDKGRGKLIKAWPVAVGTPEYPTPPGVYWITEKVRSPTWTIPDSDWAKSAGLTPGEVVQGDDPNNPLKARWMELWPEEGIGIHGTDNLSSIGTRASHGCLRMLVEDVKELYAEVPDPEDGKLTPVFID